DFPGELTDLGFYVLEDFINYFLNIDTYQALSWIMWSSSMYLVFYLFYKKVKKADINRLINKIS
ncbi:MAG: hypothetical protein ACTSPZ_09870, partial [Promethearchaeota archaeon]